MEILRLKQKLNCKRDDFQFTVSMKTRWRDLDAFQHVNNAVYATYIENARATLFNRWSIRHDGKGKSLILVSIKIDYLKQLIHPTKFDVCQRISRIGSTSFDLESALFNNESDTPICTSIATCVCFDFTKEKPVPVFKAIIDDFNDYKN